MARVLLVYVLPIALTIYAIVDIARTEDSEIKLLPKWGWVLISIFVGIVGPIAWIIAGKNRKRKPPFGRNSKGPKGPLGPDDDPDFLRGL